MSSTQTCPRCGGFLRTQQVQNLLAKHCDRCGSLPFATDTKTGETVRVDRNGRVARAAISKAEGR